MITTFSELTEFLYSALLRESEDTIRSCLQNRNKDSDESLTGFEERNESGRQFFHRINSGIE